MNAFVQVHDKYDNTGINIQNVDVSRSVTPPIFSIDDHIIVASPRNSESMMTSMFLSKAERLSQRNDDHDITSAIGAIDSCVSLTLAANLRSRMSLGCVTERDHNQFANPPTSFDRSNRNISQYQTGEATNHVNHHLQSKRKKKTKRKKNHGLRKTRAANESTAVFFSECYLQGIGYETAGEAARKSHDNYKKWWLQEINPDGITSLGDSFAVPKFRQTLHPKIVKGSKRDRLGHDSQSHRESLLKPNISFKKQEMKNEIANLDRILKPSILRPTPLRTIISTNNQLQHRSLFSSETPNLSILNGISEDIESNRHYHQIPEALNTSDLNMDTVSRLTKRKRLNISFQNNTENEYLTLQEQNDMASHKIGNHNDSKRRVEENISECNSTREVKLPVIVEECLPSQKQFILPKLKMELLQYLACSGGDITDKKFLGTLEQLRTLYTTTGWDACSRAIHGKEKRKIDGMWLTLSRPNFNDCLGRNSDGDYMYTLGRMSFDMFRPINLICSINGMFNLIRPETAEEVASIPKSLRNKVASSCTGLRSYEIIVAFTIEPESLHFGKNSPNSAVRGSIRGIMTVHAHVLPDPDVPNRLSIWFTGGEMKPNNSASNEKEWKKLFGAVLPKRQIQEKARILAAKLFLGAHVPEKMEDDGTLRYNLSRPMGGHGVAYIDVLYLDDTLRIVQGHHGSIFVHVRVPSISS